MSDLHKFGWHPSMIRFDVGDKVTIIDIDGKEWTGIVQEDGSIRGEPEYVVSPDLTLALLVEDTGYPNGLTRAEWEAGCRAIATAGLSIAEMEAALKRGKADE